MEKTNEKKLSLNPIGDTPFCHASNGEKYYISCGKVIMEIESDYEETKQLVEQKPWKLIALLCEALINEILNNKQTNK